MAYECREYGYDTCVSSERGREEKKQETAKSEYQGSCAHTCSEKTGQTTSVISHYPQLRTMMNEKIIPESTSCYRCSCASLGSQPEMGLQHAHFGDSGESCVPMLTRTNGMHSLSSSPTYVRPQFNGFEVVPVAVHPRCGYYCKCLMLPINTVTAWSETTPTHSNTFLYPRGLIPFGYCSSVQQPAASVNQVAARPDIETERHLHARSALKSSDKETSSNQQQTLKRKRDEENRLAEFYDALFLSCPEPDCPFKTDRPHLLRSHLQCHKSKEEGSRRFYACPEKNCGYIGNDSSNLKVHLRKHTGFKPFLCTAEGCNYASTQKNNVKVHIKRNHPPMEAEVRTSWNAN